MSLSLNHPNSEAINADLLTPSEIVDCLDAHIVGQAKAKRAVAVALRNRVRRQKLPENLRQEVIPKNILMIGPTGVGKTEIARRLAKLCKAPFLKVEVTRFTEVGYVGRDVESLIRDLVSNALNMVSEEKKEALKPLAEKAALEEILEILHPMPQGPARSGANDEERQKAEFHYSQSERIRERLRDQLVRGEIDAWDIEIEVEEGQNTGRVVDVFHIQGMEDMGNQMGDILSGLMPKKTRKRKTTIAEAKKLLTDKQFSRVVDTDEVQREAIHRVEETAIVFLDEFDKIAGGSQQKGGPDVSREGVQRDLLPIIEGSTVNTRYGPVRTEHILFIAAGAFHFSKPSDLIPEIQGRLPIRVELDPLKEEDFVRILTEPKASLIEQYRALLEVDGVTLRVEEEGVRELARMAFELNQKTENIGARRLHALLERTLEDLLFEAPDKRKGEVVVDKAFVQDRLLGIVKDLDLSRFIL